LLQVSSNFFSHIQNRHNDLLKQSPGKAIEAEFGPAFQSGDVIGIDCVITLVHIAARCDVLCFCVMY
jgi:hypothetical protein